jgi:hypothetical protein
MVRLLLEVKQQNIKLEQVYSQAGRTASDFMDMASGKVSGVV